MSTWPRRAALILSLTLGGLGAGIAAAQMNPDDVINARKANMRDLAGPSKHITDQMKLAEKDWVHIEYSARELADYPKTIPIWFAADVRTGARAKTRAKPEVWTDKAGFRAELKRFSDAVAPLPAMAGRKDAAAMDAQMVLVRQSCATCHDKYRSK